MQLYETIFIARQDMSPAQVETLTEKFSSIIVENNGQVGKTEYCGLRTLAHLINKNRKGHYVLMNITADGAALKEMERQMQISENTLRFLSIKVDAHETGPSALLKSSRYGREEGQYSRSGSDNQESNENSSPTASTTSTEGDKE